MSTTEAIPHDPRLAVRGLQTCAMNGLSHWLEFPADPNDSPETTGLADIAQLLAEPDRDVTRVQRQAVRRFSGRFQVTDPPDWTMAQTVWLADPSILPGWDRLLRQATDRLRTVMGRGAQPFAAHAPNLMAAVVAQAWHAPTFRRQIAAMIRKHVHARVILAPIPTPVPVLATPTLWAAATSHLDRTARSGPRNQRRLAGQFRTRVAAEFEAENWAGFWDGYVLGRAKALGVGLPGPDLSRTAENYTTDMKHYRKNWRDEAPGLALQLLNNMI
ncbi:hypothetical protein [uncultured Tateyamaria sp.]|uniref:hypothetical protein n=1 Tax=uncultured Tateyamaria sp. TaxID=455651 RepID=UPI00262119C9|nr:hypothetical protein [uncultured Tateyamaria sp.]